jgi:hypothetical protein
VVVNLGGYPSTKAMSTSLLVHLSYVVGNVRPVFTELQLRIEVNWRLLVHIKQVERAKLSPLLQTYMSLALVDLRLRSKQVEDLLWKLLSQDLLWVNAPELGLNLEQLRIILILEQWDVITLISQVIYHMFKDDTFSVEVNPFINHLEILSPGEEFGHETVFDGGEHRLADRDLVSAANIQLHDLVLAGGDLLVLLPLVLKLLPLPLEGLD